MHDVPRFIFITCQVGSEAAVKRELAVVEPLLRLAFSRPGFMTFKLPEGYQLRADFDLKLVFARCWGFSLGRVEAYNPHDVAHQAWQLHGERPARRVHVWSRDMCAPTDRGFEPGVSVQCRTIRAAMIAGRVEQLAPGADDPLAEAKSGEFILDCVLVDRRDATGRGHTGSGNGPAEPDDPAWKTGSAVAESGAGSCVGAGEWWIGYHRAGRPPTNWPGGIPPLNPPPELVSRAWLKTEEAIRWSGFPIGRPGGLAGQRGPRVVELGSAPGGSAQALLERGCDVLGVDPAEMDPRVLGHPRFRHLRRHASQAKRRDFRKARWLLADMNVAPGYTLDVVGDIVTHPEVHIRGLLLTLKLPQWELAERVPEYVARVKRWGFNEVAVRQLAYQHQEICLAGLKRPFRKTGKPRHTVKGQPRKRKEPGDTSAVRDGD